MASIQQRGDSWFAQVRIKKSGVIVFSESRTFSTKAMAESWALRMEKKVRAQGAPDRKISVGELIRRHLDYQRKLRPLGRSTIHNHQTVAQAFDKVDIAELTAKHITDYVTRRKAEGTGPATILANLSPLAAAIHAAPYAHGVQADPQPVDLAIKKLKGGGSHWQVQADHIRLVDDEEEETLLAEFERRNHHHQTGIDMVLVNATMAPLCLRIKKPPHKAAD